MEANSMKILFSEQRLCTCCMKEHKIDTVEIKEKITFKGISVNYNAVYEYCSYTDELSETEAMIRANGLSVKDAYRKEVGLLTSNEIKSIREKYKVSQKEFSEILNWGMATITRYENHQIQDRAHDDFLRKINSDPKWFLDILERSKDRISPKMYLKYFNNAYEQYIKKDNPYSYSFISTNVSFNELEPLRDNTNIGRYYNKSCKINRCGSLSYPTISVNVDEISVCAF